MKKLFSILITIGLLGTLAYSQNDLGKADDIGRISIAPMISDLSGDIPVSAQKILISKMSQMAALNGMAALPSNPLFIMYPAVNVLSKEITPTAPPMQAINIEVSFFIADLATGNIYSETSLELKGVGKTEDQAYLQALKNINYKKGQFKAFIETGKEKIVEYFNSNCDVVLSTAKTLISQNKNDLALLYLLSVPAVSKECYDNAMVLAQTIEPSVESAPVEEEEEIAEEQSAGLTAQISKDIVMEYVKAKVFGQETYIYIKIINIGQEDVDMSFYAPNFRIIDDAGNTYMCSKLKSGEKQSSGWHEATIIPEVEMNLEVHFEQKIKGIKLFELEYKGNKYKIRNIPSETIQ